ncbi:MAG TPA: hypothetical protein VER32_02600 [Pyrinomonadaceae bacterium]|nr:hypothetical protein [Pyrinomonadaceae bacterium]
MDRSHFGLRVFRARSAWLAVAAFVLAAGFHAPALAQNERYAINLAQDAVRQRVMRDVGGSAAVTFDSGSRTETYYVANNRTGVRGEGNLRRSYNSPVQRFTYEAVVNTRNRRVDQIRYDFVGDTGDGDYDDTDRAPRWLVGTFRGRNPSGRQGQYMDVTIERDGDVMAVYENGTRESGRYNNGQLQIGNRAAWSVARSGDGFRATARRRSETFVRTSNGGGDGDWRGDSGRIPRWLIGTFRGVTDSGESELTISADGAAAARSLQTGETFYGRFDNRRLRFDWGEYDVTRTNDGIRTTNVNNRNDVTDYRRVGNY